MENSEFQKAKEKVNVVYDYIRGSHAHGLNTPTSDIDTSFVYIAPYEGIIGPRGDYKPQIEDEKNDNVGYELGRFLELLEKSNPTMLESLFIPRRCVTHEDLIMKKLIENKEKFLTKDALKSLSEYSMSQIKKARGLGKKIVNPITVRKEPIDFCFVYDGKQGSKPVLKWLEERGLKQIYCGLNNLPNMDMMHGLFYDIGQHIHMEYKNGQEFHDAYVDGGISEFACNLIDQYYGVNNILEDPSIEFNRVYETLTPKGYHGIVKESGTSCNVHSDSIPKGDLPICLMSYNGNGYESHCKQYKDYKDWEVNRNQTRYEGNLGHNYDAKNMCECIRLLTMSLELAKKGEFNVDRTGIDREFLLLVKKHSFEYEFVLSYAERLKRELDSILPTVNLPEHVDHEFVKNLLIEIRKEYYEKNCSKDVNPINVHRMHSCGVVFRS